MTRRTSCSLNEALLSRLDALAPVRDRSESGQRLIEHDPGHAAIKAVSADAGAWAFATFSRLD